VVTTSAVGNGICISNTGIRRLGGSGCSVVSFSDVLVSGGASRSAGAITIGLYDGIRAEGGLNSKLGTSKGVGSLGVGIGIDIRVRIQEVI